MKKIVIVLCLLFSVVWCSFLFGCKPAKASEASDLIIMAAIVWGGGIGVQVICDGLPVADQTVTITRMHRILVSNGEGGLKEDFEPGEITRERKTNSNGTVFFPAFYGHFLVTAGEQSEEIVATGSLKVSHVSFGCN